MATKVISTGVPFSALPDSYIRPESDRPNLSQVSECENVPVIDLGSPDRSLVIQQIADACRKYGFFQVINHGVSREVMEKTQKVAGEFFRLPVEEKMKLYSDDPSKTMRLSTSFNVQKETVHNWRDYLRLHCYPLEQYSYTPEWPSDPAAFKDVVAKYCKEATDLGMRLQEAISLGLEKDYIKNILGDQGQHMAITILLQDPQVAGHQVLKDGKWLAVKPHPNALLINIGDQLQAVSKGEYKSVCHRAVVNADTPNKLTNNGSTAVQRDYKGKTMFWKRH